MIAVPIVAQIVLRLGWLDRPGGLKRHDRGVPYGGGIGILLGVLAAVAHVPPAAGATYLMLAASLLVFAGGAWDDYRPLGIVGKFAVQALAALLLVAGGVHLNIRILPAWLNLALTLVWLVGMTNAVNLIDIMDGLCGGVTCVAALTFGLIGLRFGDHGLAALDFALSGAIAGFLPFNLHPARIFMGDAGAQFIGLLLGAAAVQGAYTTYNNLALLAPVLVLGLPLSDTALVMILRLRRGRSPFHGSADHLALRLRRLGFGVPATVRICIGITALFCVLAVAATLVELRIAIAIYLAAAALAVTLGVRLSRVDMEAAE